VKVKISLIIGNIFVLDYQVTIISFFTVQNDISYLVNVKNSKIKIILKP